MKLFTAAASVQTDHEAPTTEASESLSFSVSSESVSSAPADVEFQDAVRDLFIVAPSFALV